MANDSYAPPTVATTSTVKALVGLLSERERDEFGAEALRSGESRFVWPYSLLRGLIAHHEAEELRRGHRHELQLFLETPSAPGR